MPLFMSGILHEWNSVTFLSSLSCWLPLRAPVSHSHWTVSFICSGEEKIKINVHLLPLSYRDTT